MIVRIVRPLAELSGGGFIAGGNSSQEEAGAKTALEGEDEQSNTEGDSSRDAVQDVARIFELENHEAEQGETPLEEVQEEAQTEVRRESQTRVEWPSYKSDGDKEMAKLKEAIKEDFDELHRSVAVEIHRLTKLVAGKYKEEAKEIKENIKKYFAEEEQNLDEQLEQL